MSTLSALHARGTGRSPGRTWWPALHHGIGTGRSLPGILAAACLVFVMAAGSAPASDIDATGISLCAIGAWSTDKDPQGLNIRAAPGTDSPIIGKIPPPVELEGDLFATEVSITGSRGGWFRISEAEFIDYYRGESQVHFKGEGWVSGRHLGFWVEAGKLYRSPSIGAPVAVDFSQERAERKAGEADTFVLERLHACQRYWVEVEGTFLGARFRGWTNDTCASQVTTCP